MNEQEYIEDIARLIFDFDNVENNEMKIARWLYKNRYRKININKWKKFFIRDKEEFQLLNDEEKNLSKYGQHNLGYVEGRLSVIEELFDELDIDVNSIKF